MLREILPDSPPRGLESRDRGVLGRIHTNVTSEPADSYLTSCIADHVVGYQLPTYPHRDSTELTFTDFGAPRHLVITGTLFSFPCGNVDGTAIHTVDPVCTVELPD